MNTKQKQIKHWAANGYYRHLLYISKLSGLWSRAGMIEDTTAMRIFRLETLFQG